MDWLFSLKVFTIVAETGKMTSAGDSIFLTQPAISMQIKSLEDFYGLKLFSRSHEGLKLTEEGKLVYSHAKNILQMFDEMNAEIKNTFRTSKDDPSDNLNLGSCILISEIYMPWIIQRFTKEHPDISVNYAAMDYNSNIRSVLEGKLDIAIIGYRDELNKDEQNELKFEKCSREQLEIIVPKNYGLRNMQKIDIKFLMGKSYIALKPECGISCIFKHFLKKNNTKFEDLKIVGLFGSGSAIKTAVVEGLGWGILPKEYISEELKEGKLNVVRLQGQQRPLYRWLYTVYPRAKEKIPVVKLFLQFLKMLKGKQCSLEILKKELFEVEKT
ncbi:MAG: LysR family transcriptional regulator [Thermodesulfovibrionales bacterium]